jgi:hypothetical protein
VISVLNANGRVDDMNFDQLKKLVKKLGGILVLNGNEPEFVILSFDQYQKTDGAVSDEREVFEGPDFEGPDDEKTIEKLNREILALKEEIRQKESAELIEDTIENAEEREPIADVIDFE